ARAGAGRDRRRGLGHRRSDGRRRDRGRPQERQAGRIGAGAADLPEDRARARRHAAARAAARRGHARTGEPAARGVRVRGRRVSKGAKILLVDDDPAVLRGVSGLLRDEGYRTVEARDTIGAWAALHAARDLPAMMLLDLRLPGESGLALLERLPRPLAVPVVVLSGEAKIADTVRALKLGATDFVEKP